MYHSNLHAKIMVFNIFNKYSVNGLMDRGVASRVRGPGFDSRYCRRFSSHDVFELVPLSL